MRAGDDHRRRLRRAGPQETERHPGKNLPGGYGRARGGSQERPGGRMHHEGPPPVGRDLDAQRAERRVHRPSASDDGQRPDVRTERRGRNGPPVRRRGRIYPVYRSGIRAVQGSGRPDQSLQGQIRQGTRHSAAAESRHLRRRRHDGRGRSHLRPRALDDREGGRRIAARRRQAGMRLRAGSAPGYPHDAQQARNQDAPRPQQRADRALCLVRKRICESCGALLARRDRLLQVEIHLSRRRR